MSQRSKNVESSFIGYVNNTPKGEKKDTKTKMQDKYYPAHVESAWYDWWNKKGYFTAQNDTDKERFVIMLPPPNVTGSLHIGHALTSAIQDCMIRFKKMDGKNILYLPGVDHAGIATQVVVEKTLFGQTGKTRHDLGREKFVEKVWEWKEDYGNRICEQLKRMGSSLDWSRYRFTLDDKYVEAVNEAFIQMNKKGLIYREKRIVNWDCTLHTAVSNIEVDRVDLTATKIKIPGYKKAVDFGYMWDFAYKIDGSDEEIIVSTTRPETMLGDTGVAVHSKDERYKHLHGKFVVHPFNGRKIPIVCDDELVNPEFGTGAVKITPAHDPEDFECGKRNNLEFINILNDDGTLNKNAKPFEGLKRYDVRVKVLEELEKKGLLKKRTPYKLTVGICSRSKDVIEPVVKPQWFVKWGDIAKKAVEVVENGELEMVPKMHEKKWKNWLGNVHDWCISRQLWWGHRIPAYFVKEKGLTNLEENEKKQNSDYWIIAKTKEDAEKIAKEKFKDIEFTLEQDEDVLDTWFSSGLFPFATLGWPKKTKDLDDFYPGSVLETGGDILFFWVARMVLMGLALTDKLPFKTVFLHSMVRDKDGKKMSKSDGNIIDPINCIEGISLKDLNANLEKLTQLTEKKRKQGIKLQKKQFPNGIPECGTDALRFTLLNYTSNNGIDINLDIKKVFGYRTFCNKIWNATKYALQFAGLEKFVPDHSKLLKHTPKIFINQWILTKLNQTIEASNKNLTNFEYYYYTTGLYDFFLKEYCGIYLEAIKSIINGENKEEKEETISTIYTVLENFFRLLHPTMPFITEELWQRLPGRDTYDKESIMLCSYPKPNNAFKFDGVLEKMEVLNATITKIRSVKGVYQITNKVHPSIYLICKDKKEQTAISQELKLINDLALCGEIKFVANKSEIPKGCVIESVSSSIVVGIYLKGIVDFAKEIKSQEKKIGKKKKYMEKLEKKINSEKFKKTPEFVQAKQRKSFEETKEQIKQMEETITLFKSFLE